MNGEKSLKGMLQKINDSNKEVYVTLAKVISKNPATFQLENDEKMKLSERVVSIPDSFKNRVITVNVNGERAEITIENELKVGDTVHLLAYNYGKKYYVLGRVS